MRPRDLPPPAARCARRPRRWPGHRARRSCGRCRSRAPAPVPKAWAARPPPTRLSAANLPARYRPRPPAFSTAQRRSGNRFAQRSRALKPARSLREASTLEELAFGFVDRSDGDRRLVGIDPDEHLHARVPPFRSDLRHHRRARRTFRLRAAAPIPLLSHSARRGHRRDASREQANPSYGRQEVRERSLYNRHPRSLAAADHQAPEQS